MWFLPVAAAQSFFDAAVDLPIVTSEMSGGSGVADVDGDGLWDLVTVMPDGLSVSRNLGGSFEATMVPALNEFTVPQERELLHHVRSHLWADFNGDGHLDVTIATSERHGILTSALGSYSVVDIQGLIDDTLELQVAFDWDHDGDIDIMAAGNTEAFSYINEGGVFTETTPWLGPTEFTEYSDHGMTADLDNDGVEDIVYRVEGSSKGILRGQLEGPFVDDWSVTGFTGVNDRPKGHLAICDILPGGALEVLNAESTTDTVTLLELTGTSWSPAILSFSGVPSAIACADFDNDGTLDLAIGGTEDWIYREGFPANAIDIRLDTPEEAITTGLVPADIDDDGDLDLLITRTGAPTQLLYNGSAPTAHLQLRLMRAQGDDCASPALRDDFGAQATVSGTRQAVMTNSGRGGSSWPVLHWGGVTGETVVSYRWSTGETHEILVNPLDTPRRVVATTLDADGDGLSDTQEGDWDLDNDGFPASHDWDANGDGVPDSDIVPSSCLDALPDANGDGVPDYATPPSTPVDDTGLPPTPPPNDTGLDDTGDPAIMVGNGCGCSSTPAVSWLGALLSRR